MSFLNAHGQQSDFATRRAAPLVALLLTAVCLALPARSPSADAWYYAACARWEQELYQPHHLLYNAIGWGWLRLLGAAGLLAPAGPGALPALQALNALAFGGCLLALNALLRWAGASAAARPAWLLLAGSCFGMLRFATDNETYIQPLLLALLASVAWAAALAAEKIGRRQRLLGLAGLLAALACLVHQLLVWWWLGLLLGLLLGRRPWSSGRGGRNGRGRPALGAVLAYAAPALLVPLAYALAAPAADGPGSAGLVGVLRFALHDYLSGGARVELGGRALLLTAISLVRTLGQVHGNLLPLLRHWPLSLGTVALGCGALAIYALLSGWRGGGRRNVLAVSVADSQTDSARAIDARTVAGATSKTVAKAATKAAADAAPIAQTAAARALLAKAATPEMPVAQAPVAQTVIAEADRHAAAARHVRRTHALIFGLQLAFAASAAGNAEFMALLPALAAVALAGGWLRVWPPRRVAALGLALLGWNVAVGLLPAHTLVLEPPAATWQGWQRAHPRGWFVLRDPNAPRNQRQYANGRPTDDPRLRGLPPTDSPAWQAWLRARRAAHDTLYTDALGGTRAFDRAQLTQGLVAERLLAGWQRRRVDSVATLGGARYLTELVGE